MSHEQFFYSLTCIVLFCLGWRMITDEGQIFNFLRRPFEDLHKKIADKNELANLALKMGDKDLYSSLSAEGFKMEIAFCFLKPTILCITCFASFWGGLIFIFINGDNMSQLPYLIGCCISASFIQTFIWKLYERL